MKQNDKRDLKAKFNEVVYKLIEDNSNEVAEQLGVDNIALFEISKGSIVETEYAGETVCVNIDSVVKSNSFDLEDALMEFEDRKKREAEREAKKLEKLRKLEAKAKEESEKATE